MQLNNFHTFNRSKSYNNSYKSCYTPNSEAKNCDNYQDSGILVAGILIVIRVQQLKIMVNGISLHLAHNHFLAKQSQQQRMYIAVASTLVIVQTYHSLMVWFMVEDEIPCFMRQCQMFQAMYIVLHGIHAILHR